jgi:hypothetical protein
MYAGMEEFDEIPAEAIDIAGRQNFRAALAAELFDHAREGRIPPG